jgi:hypothetical protein
MRRVIEKKAKFDIMDLNCLQVLIVALILQFQMCLVLTNC